MNRRQNNAGVGATPASPAPVSPGGPQGHNIHIAPLVQMRGITQRLGPVLANDRVNLDRWPGEVHAVLGENGAGKTTLMNILAGMYQPDAGTIRIAGEEVQIASPADALHRGIGTVYQH